MTKTIVIILAFIPAIMFGQKTTKITDKENNEVFYVLKSDKVTKQGEYKKYGLNKSILIKGYYKNGLKDSIWEYYGSNDVVLQKYDFSRNKLMYFKPSDAKDDKKYKLLNGADNPEVKLDRPPVFLGGDEYRNHLLAKNIIYPQSATENGTQGTVNVFFTIDKSGKTSNYHVNNPLGSRVDDESIRVLKLVSDNWLPGILNGQPVDIEYMIPVYYRLQ